jgi:Ca-activated chloride channel family protein
MRKRFVRAGKRAACGVALFFALLSGGCVFAFGQQAAPLGDGAQSGANAQRPLIRQRTELVNLTVTVTDRNGHAVPGLTAQEVELYEDNVKQKIEFYAAEDAPISVGVILDVSSSMWNKLGQARAAILAFVETSHRDDDFFLAKFSERVSLVSDFCDGEALIRRLDPGVAQGETALYDAVSLGVEKVQQGRHRKRALLVISDGQDNASRYTLEQLRRRLKESDVQIYGIGVNRAIMSEKAEQRETMRGLIIMDEIARMTGGQSFFVRSASELEAAAARVALELRRQYSLGYMPTAEQNDGRWRKIRVHVTRPPGAPERVVRAKAGYYAAP